ncbi:YciI family protein [Cupriavidus necator]|uniref:YciI family protein n=1 Tax=Cupriavidus necator TaxID=106590 RepID=UPI0039C25A41
MDINDNARALLANMLQKPLYVALRTPNDLSRFSEVLEAHLQWAIAAEQRGELFASGPFVEEGGVPGALGGMSIIRAASMEEAQQILSWDPFIRQQVYTPSIMKWLLMEGGVTVTLRFSDQSYLLR